MTDPRRLRVSFVLPDFGAGGAQRVVVTIANNIDRARFAPTIVAFDDRGPWRALVASDVQVVNLESPRVRWGLRALRAALRRDPPDAVVSTIGYLNLAVLMVRPAGTPVLVRESNMPHRAAGGVLSRAIHKLAYAALYRRADAVVSPSNLIAGELSGDFHVPQQLIRVIHNPVDEAGLRADAIPTQRRKGAGGRFVAVGRLSPQKGYDRLLEIVGTLPTDTRIVVFGEGEERAALEAQARALGVAERVTFAGFDPYPAPWVAGADALILPSRWEGLPNVALEALACGTPVIATPEAGGIDEIAAHAPPGAVTLAPMGPGFAAAMQAAPRNETASLRPSLLPDEFRLASVVAEYERTLQAIVLKR